MEKDINVLALKLHDAIKEDEVYKRIKEIEEVMMNDHSIVALISEYQKSQDVYNDCLKYNLDTKEAVKKISDAKIKLYENEIVKEYQDLYLKLNNELQKISELLFDDLIFDLK